LFSHHHHAQKDSPVSKLTKKKAGTSSTSKIGVGPYPKADRISDLKCEVEGHVRAAFDPTSYRAVEEQYHLAQLATRLMPTEIRSQIAAGNCDPQAFAPFVAAAVDLMDATIEHVAQRLYRRAEAVARMGLAQIETGEPAPTPLDLSQLPPDFRKLLRVPELATDTAHPSEVGDKPPA
jgi:hypothetical protein